LLEVEAGGARLDQPQRGVGSDIGVALHVPEPAPATVGILLADQDVERFG
jgi:hypothetical protein